MTTENKIRIDKFLWAVRIFKTRSLSAEACNNGKVKINGVEVKPAREIKTGDTINIRIGIINKTIKIKELLKNRVAASIVEKYIDDLTPQEEYNKAKLNRERDMEWRDRGTGRPTKKDRRLIDKLKRDDRFRD